jgi:hypothetical protein
MRAASRTVPRGPSDNRETGVFITCRTKEGGYPHAGNPNATHSSGFISPNTGSGGQWSAPRTGPSATSAAVRRVVLAAERAMVDVADNRRPWHGKPGVSLAMTTISLSSQANVALGAVPAPCCPVATLARKSRMPLTAPVCRRGGSRAGTRDLESQPAEQNEVAMPFRPSA